MADPHHLDDDYDSDEDFLTLDSGTNTSGKSRGGSGAVDREALVRKKLLENFYGKSAVQNVDGLHPWTGSSSHQKQDQDRDSDDDNQTYESSILSRGGSRGDVGDLDSAAFNAEMHTRRHVLGSSVHTLLDIDEQLALQVRTLDSTMQTLVYENYSRFIDATDAIRSIGVNVSANQAGLERLVQGMESVERNSRLMEEQMGSLRDQVAEKIRVKRLLKRLDTLLKLPKTLRQQIAEGKYKTATKSYLSAVSILSKHSEGFESLRTIETECNIILEHLKADLHRKLLHWSGRSAATSYETTNTDDSLELLYPKCLTEIFECSGALLILLHEDDTSNNNNETTTNFLSGSMDSEDLQNMSLSASMRLLDRLLDAHMIQVQERRFSTPLDTATTTTAMGADYLFSSLKLPSLHPTNDYETQPHHHGGSGGGGCGVSLIPIDFLHGILETATLFRTTFCGGGDGSSNNNSSTGAPSGSANHRLTEFISEAFSTFLLHVRAILLEESIHEQETTPSATTTTTTSTNEDADVAQQEVSAALALLVSSVRDLSDRLVSIVAPAEVANLRLVEQVLQLTESMVRRRVDQTFFKLRQSVVHNCLVPFVERAVATKRATAAAETAAAGGEQQQPPLQSIVQIGGSTLSDCLQLVDDTIRTIFSNAASATTKDASSSTINAVDLPILKEAVQASTNRFAAWLASAFEILAGGESSDPQFVLEAPPPLDPAAIEDHNIKAEHPLHGLQIHHQYNPTGAFFSDEDLGDDNLAGENNAVLDLIDQAHKALLTANGHQKAAAETLDSDFILAIAEMCRLAQGSVSESLEQSIASHIGGGKKKQRGLFPSDHHETAGDVVTDTSEITTYFQMACSRLVVLFAVTRGTEMANLLSKDISSMMSQEELVMVPPAPRGEAYDALQIVKQTAIECAGLYGGPERAGPVPKMEEDSLAILASSLLSRKTGLQLDIERMFKEKVEIYPHPQERLEATRNSILSIVMKISFRALLEHVRMSSVSEAGFRQLQIDTEFLKLMIPHYISKDFSLQGSNVQSSLISLLADVMASAGERCSDPFLGENEDVKHECREAVRLTMDGIEATDVAEKFIIQDSD